MEIELKVSLTDLKFKLNKRSKNVKGENRMEWLKFLNNTRIKIARQKNKT